MMSVVLVVLVVQLVWPKSAMKMRREEVSNNGVLDEVKKNKRRCGGEEEQKKGQEEGGESNTRIDTFERSPSQGSCFSDLQSEQRCSFSYVSIFTYLLTPHPSHLLPDLPP